MDNLQFYNEMDFTEIIQFYIYFIFNNNYLQLLGFCVNNKNVKPVLEINPISYKPQMVLNGFNKTSILTKLECSCKHK